MTSSVKLIGDADAVPAEGREGAHQCYDDRNRENMRIDSGARRAPGDVALPSSFCCPKGRSQLSFQPIYLCDASALFRTT